MHLPPPHEPAIFLFLCVYTKRISIYLSFCQNIFFLSMNLCLQAHVLVNFMNMTYNLL